MTEETIDHVRTMLETVLEDVEDQDDRFRLRTALQYLDLLEAEEQALAELSTADPDETAELTARLADLGYTD